MGNYVPELFTLKLETGNELLDIKQGLELLMKDIITTGYENRITRLDSVMTLYKKIDKVYWNWLNEAE